MRCSRCGYDITGISYEGECAPCNYRKTTMTNLYPFKVAKLNRAALAEFAECEWPSWEDAGRPGDGETRDDGTPCAYNILTRHSTVLEIKSHAELLEIAQRLQTSTFQVLEGGHLRAAQTLARRLRPYCVERDVTPPNPDGF